jgi:hypothetical protein
MISIHCRGLSEEHINKEIKIRTAHSINPRLKLIGYDHETLESIIFPDQTIQLNCSFSKLTSFKSTNIVSINGITASGLTLPNKLNMLVLSHNNITDFSGLVFPNTEFIIFDCSHNKITSLAELKLPNSLIEFNCSNNQITNLSDLILPNNITKFDCSSNFDIKDLSNLVLPPSLEEFNCSYTGITNLSELTLGPNIISFKCHGNEITVIQDYDFPKSLLHFDLDSSVLISNPKFNSVLKQQLNNKVTYDEKLSRDNLLFIYLNFNLKFSEYDLLINMIELTYNLLSDPENEQQKTNSNWIIFYYFTSIILTWNTRNLLYHLS